MWFDGNHMEILDGKLDTSVARAVRIIAGGGIVAFPTETVYGLGADALNAHAVVKVFEAKQRPYFDPLIVHVGEKSWLHQIGDDLDPLVDTLTDHFWPGPLTIIVRKKTCIPDIVTAGLGTVGVRMPSHPIARRLLQAYGGPIAAPSANPFGYLSPTRAEHVAMMFPEGLPIILDGGPSEYGVESTIVSVSHGRIFIHRHGAVTEEELTHITPHVFLKEKEPQHLSYESPGEHPFHYAPRKPLIIIDSVDAIKTDQSSFLAFSPPLTPPLSRHVRILTEKGDIREAAANFFSFLIELDRGDVELIYAQHIPEVGLGKAMMERLRKASKKHLFESVDNLNHS